MENGETYSPGVTSLSEAQEKGWLAVEGRVISTTYLVDRTTHTTTSVATLDVTGASPGSEVAGHIEVVQIGGPAWTEDGIGVLQQLEGDPLLLPGDHVILVLVPACAEEHRAEGRYQTIFGAGIYHVTPDGVRAPDSNAFSSSVAGLNSSELLGLFPQDSSRSGNSACHG